MKFSVYFLIIVSIISFNVYYYWEFFWTPWAKFYTRDQDVVVSFTTTPYRINQLKDMLDTLSNQTFKPRQIYLNIPNIFKRDNLGYQIPQWLLEYPNLSILRTEDYGPATKLLGTLKYAPIKHNTIIITVDDDECYPKNTLLQLVVRAKKYPDSAVGYSGTGLKYCYLNVDNIPAIMLEGFAGVAYRPYFFDDSIFDIAREPVFCYNCDDLYISFHLAKNNVMRRTVHTRIMNSEKVKGELYSNTEHSLHLLPHTDGDRYRMCTEYLHNKFANVNFSW